ncbi:MAG TPA: tyrosine-type recombinase/integrase [Bacteriovoracaceae bacterium]|nr:tyrosine-type recombinase/integrase [Bacteriovoracaceae bacterium]
MAKKAHALTLIQNPDLAKKFQEASLKKTEIQDFINEFLVGFLSPDTKTAYVKDLKFFFGFLSSGSVTITHPSQIESYHFQLYRDHLLERGLASATVNRRLVCIRSFMKWAVASKLTSHNPLDTVKLPRVQTESPTVAFDDAEVQQMIQAPDLGTHRGKNHRLIMVLLFHLGLRRSELTGLQLRQMAQDRGHMILRIHGKGDKTRLVPLNAFVHYEISAYLEHLKNQGVSLGPDDYLLQTELKLKNERPMDGSTIYRVIEKYAQSLGINKSVSPHSCRATVISHLLDTQHTPIRDVATFAGHANITTTERYDKRRKNLDTSAAYQVDFAVPKISEK